MDGLAKSDLRAEQPPAAKFEDVPIVAAPLRSVMIGTESLLVECARILRDNGHEIVAIVAPPGPVAEWASRTGLRHLTRAQDLLGADLERIDYLFSVTNLTVLPRELLSLARRAAINFHDGPLPEYAGLNTPAWALLSGEERHGITWHLMTETIDGGDVLASEAIDIEPGETALSLNTKCFEAGIRTFAQLAKRLNAETLPVIRQPGPPLRWLGRRDRPAAAATIDWDAPAEAIARLVSALDFGAYRNPLGAPKALLGDKLFLVHEVELLDSASGLPAGTVIESGSAPLVATASSDLRLTRITELDGTPILRLAAAPGEKLASLDDDMRAALGALDAAAGLYESWWHRRLAERDCLHLPQFRATSSSGSAQRASFAGALAGTRTGRELVAALVGFFGRVADRPDVDLGYADHVHHSRLQGLHPWFADQLPLRTRIDWDQPLFELTQDVNDAISQLHRRVGIAADLLARSPELRGGPPLAHPICIQLADTLDAVPANAATILTVAVSADGRSCQWSFDPRRLDPADAQDLWRGFQAMLASADAAPGAPLGWLPLLSRTEQDRTVRQWNSDSAPVRQLSGIHQAIVEQVARTPDRIAISSRGRSISYSELDARSNQLARHLCSLGVGPDALVGLSLERSIDIPVAMLAIHKAGGAYLPLDPAYPAARLAHMIADSRLKVILTQESLAAALPASGAQIVRLDVDAAKIAHFPADAFDAGAGPANLAYVIYTSGSTGLPKGVMVEHRNLLNFVAGMDAKLEPDGVWLAVTSPSFDISVLELLWPLTRGYRVVVATEREIRGDIDAGPPQRPVAFSLFYFASADSASNADQYQLLLGGAKFADENGFEAVWTPERHFHAFGGLYPNPSVTSAAIAAITKRVGIRAGSVVAPLHHPARIAEEWSLVDNLSNGRTGIAFASGWQPDDFLLRPENFADRNGALMRCIDDVRALWRGEQRSFPGPLGRDVEVGIFPRPCQAELPFWITSAGNPDTFAAAGRAGAFILTHLLGQSVAEVGAKLEIYRRAWREAGHAGDGRVTLMLHSFVGADANAVRSIVRGPLIEYLRASAGLLKQYAWSFPAFKRPKGGDAADLPDLASLTPEETEALLEHAFERYFDSSGLFGTPEDCLGLVGQLREIGVDEIGCLIDFGVPTATALAHLPQLNRLRLLAGTGEEACEMGLAELIGHHGVTHLQCTPSLARMLAADPATRARLRSIRRLMVGGEAFPPDLAREMTRLVGGAVMNMYGPTETTIWSAVHELRPDEACPPLGRPLANQQIYLLDRRLEPVRPGTPGELVIGGAGVVRGYLNRPELTHERFVADQFAPGGRAYRTGDLARQRDDGTIEFLGRMDHQVKIRGYRIELGEIEAALVRHLGVREAVVVARGEGEDARIIGYCVGPDAPLDLEESRQRLRSSLPEFMIPAALVRLDALPRTPNGKTDRRALPDPLPAATAAGEGPAPAANSLQEQILAVWRDVLKVERVGLRDNFFDIGGHSLLALQAHRRLSAAMERPLSLTDLFRFPTVEKLSAHLAGTAADPMAAREGQGRAGHRRAALSRRTRVNAFVRS